MNAIFRISTLVYNKFKLSSNDLKSCKNDLLLFLKYLILKYRICICNVLIVETTKTTMMY